MRYTPSTKVKSDLYHELLPLLNAGRVVLPRRDRLLAQLVALERRTARGSGRDSVDHPPGAHDDLANAVAGACAVAVKPGYDNSMAWVGDELSSAADWRRQRIYWHIMSGGRAPPSPFKVGHDQFRIVSRHWPTGATGPRRLEADLLRLSKTVRGPSRWRWPATQKRERGDDR
jgi:hypothetical protein